jgi:opacity protein-like surface antigen
MHRFAKMVAVALGLAVVAAPAQAQVSWNVGAGLALPSGDIANGLKTGYGAAIGANFHPASMPIGFRIEAAYDRFTFKASTSDNFHFFSGTANVVYNIKTAGMLAPYLIGGLGMYNAGSSVSGSTSETKFGFNVGAGLDYKLPSGIGIFLEGRYHSVQTSGATSNFIPVRVGLMIGGK